MEIIYSGPERRRYERRTLRDRRRVFKNPNFKGANRRHRTRRNCIDRRNGIDTISN